MCLTLTWRKESYGTQIHISPLNPNIPFNQIKSNSFNFNFLLHFILRNLGYEHDCWKERLHSSTKINHKILQIKSIIISCQRNYYQNYNFDFCRNCNIVFCKLLLTLLVFKWVNMKNIKDYCLKKFFRFTKNKKMLY